METVRFGIIGLGTIGSHHALTLGASKIGRATLTAVCDSANPARHDWVRQQVDPGILAFDTPEALFASGKVDAVIIATPHYFHPPLAVAAFAQKLHVLVEKPAGVHTRQVREMNAAAGKSGKVFGIMFACRAMPLYQKVYELVHSGELGRIIRHQWICTDWFRPQSYYDAGGWRATWSGEGGGVLINQAPHHLDLWQWIFGMPRRVRAFCHFGRHHAIEVEDEVTAYVEYEQGATGLFIASTGESPGTNRLEIAGDHGKLVLENQRLVFHRTRQPISRFSREFQGGFGNPECWKCEIPIESGREEPGNHTVIEAFVGAILDGTPLFAPGSEGLNSLMLGNAMLLSTWTDAWVDIPFDDEHFYNLLQERIAASTVRKDVAAANVLDARQSFGQR